MPDDLDALRPSCDRALGGHGPVRAADLLATIPADTVVDRYGDGGVVAELEAFRETALELAREGLWTWPVAMPSLDPASCRVELSVGEATCALGAAQVVSVVSRFVPAP